MAREEERGHSTARDSSSRQSESTATSILIIDDEIGQDDALARLLCAEGFHVRCAASGRDGIALATSVRHDAIVLDLHLPDILGLTVLSELRRADVTSPVIAITGWYLDGGYEELVGALGGEFLSKPLDVGELAAAVRTAIAGLPERSTRGLSLPTAARSTSRLRCASTNECELRALHERVVMGDAAAAEAVMVRLLPALEAGLRKRCFGADRDWIHDAAMDSLLEYAERPMRYDPALGALERFLAQASWWKLMNRIDTERRRATHEIHTDDAEELAAPPSRRLFEDQDVTWIIRESTADFSDSDRRLLRLWAEGESCTGRFAETAGISHLSLAEQRIQVKRQKDRLFQRLRRWGARFNR